MPDQLRILQEVSFLSFEARGRNSLLFCRSVWRRTRRKPRSSWSQLWSPIKPMRTGSSCPCIKAFFMTFTIFWNVLLGLGTVPLCTNILLSGISRLSCSHFFSRSVFVQHNLLIAVLLCNPFVGGMLVVVRSGKIRRFTHAIHTIDIVAITIPKSKNVIRMARSRVSINWVRPAVTSATVVPDFRCPVASFATFTDSPRLLVATFNRDWMANFEFPDVFPAFPSRSRTNFDAVMSPALTSATPNRHLKSCGALPH